jgi:WD40 repeat protein
MPDASRDWLAALAWRELEAVLDQELWRLPESNRAALVLCYLQGKTQEEAAAALGCPLGTVRSRVARGRALLQKRLVRRGLTLSGAAFTTALLAHAAASPLPAQVVEQTAAIVRGLTAGKAITGLVSPPVTALVRSGMRMLWASSLRAMAAPIVALAATLAAAVAVAHWSAEPGTPPPPTEQQARSPDKGAVPTDARDDSLPSGALVRMGTLRFRDEDPFSEFVVSPDSRTVYVASDRTLSFWDLTSGRLRGRAAIRATAQSAACSPDGTTIAVGCEDSVIRLFDAMSGKEVRPLVGHDASQKLLHRGIHHVSFAADGRWLVSLGQDHTMRVWDTASGKQIRQTNGADFFVLAVSPSGNLLARQARDDPKTIVLWDVSDDRDLSRLKLDDPSSTVTFLADGKKLAVAPGQRGPGKDIVLWSVPDGKRIGKLATMKSRFTSIACSPDDRTLVVGTFEGNLRVWDLPSAVERAKVPGHGTMMRGLRFTPDGKKLISRAFENRIRVWDTASWKEEFTDPYPTHDPYTMAFSPDGRFLASGSSEGICLWDAKSGKPLRTLQTSSMGTALAEFSSDGRSLVSVDFANKVVTWDCQSGKELKSFKLPGEFRSWFGRAALSPDRTTLAIAPSLRAKSREITMWDVRSGKEICRLEESVKLPGIRYSFDGACFAPDGKTLYACGGSSFEVDRWDAVTGRSRGDFGRLSGGGEALAIAPDGRSLAVAAAGGSVCLFEVATGQSRWVAQQKDNITSVAFSPTGRLLAVANNGRSRFMKADDLLVYQDTNRDDATILDSGDGHVVRTFRGHVGGVKCLAFSPDGRKLASGGADTTVVIWDVSKINSAVAAKLSEPDRIWSDLRADAQQSYRSMTSLVAAPNDAVTLLNAKLQPVPGSDPAQIAALVQKLDSTRFADREQAMQRLKSFGDSAEPALRKALTRSTSAEARGRIETTIADIAAGHLRNLRAIEVLERIRTADARKLLERLAAGTPAAWLTQEASTTVARLKKPDSLER